MSHHSLKSRPAAAVGAKTARACDSCVRRRARWFCAADDAFLCPLCDSLIHSANPLARRHHRLRLPSSSSATTSAATTAAAAAPAWHHGFKRKPRTPRPHHKPVVPELESSVEDEDEEQQILYRVPVLDPAIAFAPTEIELEEFAANMESLLRQGMDGGDAFCLEELGLGGGGGGGGIEEEERGKGERLSFEMEVDLSRETLELDFESGSPEVKEEEGGSKGMGLKLDYEAVEADWKVTGRTPWMTGERPRMGVDDCWRECLGMWGGVGGEFVGGGIQAMDLGREARVTRYREKRRTRLFSKKIRYEVRKLNAEKRPRMKGRFVKRASFPAISAAAGGGATGGGAALAC